MINKEVVEKEIKRLVFSIKPYNIEVIVLSTNFFPGSGDNEDIPEFENDRYGTFIKLIIKNVSYENSFQNIRYFENMNEADKFLEKYVEKNKEDN